MKILPSKSKFQTGDILFFYWKQVCCLTCFTHNKYTHSAIIVRDPPWRPDLKGLYILGAQVEKFTNVEDSEIKFKLQLINFDEMIDDFNGDVYWRSLDCPRDLDFYGKLTKAYSVVHNRIYDVISVDYLRAGLGLYRGNVQRKEEFFSSTLGIYIYVMLGFVDKIVPWNILTPSILGTEKFVKHLTFKNCFLYDEIKIK